MKPEEYFSKLENEPGYEEAKRNLEVFITLANDLLDLRLEAGLSQTELAQRIGTRQANISRVESGLGNPTVKFLQKIAAALNVRLVIRFEPLTELPRRNQTRPD